MSAEIEKKFLLPAFPADELDNQELKLVSKQYIYQTYLAFSEDQEIRVRQLVDSSVSRIIHIRSNPVMGWFGKKLSTTSPRLSISSC